MKKAILLWVLAVLVTLGSAYYQRKTGPTYPVNGSVTFEGQKISYYFFRSHEGADNHTVSIDIPDTTINGSLVYVRFKSYENTVEVPLVRKGATLSAQFPGQQAAGKIQYYVKLNRGLSFVNVPESPVILRFKGPVPMWVLLPHVLIMFLAMLYSTKAGLSALFNLKNIKSETIITLILLIIGGMVFGPLLQKYAFDSYWTGVPFGFDLTDNKTLIGLIVWIFAFIAIRKQKSVKAWVLAASITLLVVFLIPHSILGSEVDYTKTPAKIEAPVNK